MKRLSCFLILSAFSFSCRSPQNLLSGEKLRFFTWNENFDWAQYKIRVSHDELDRAIDSLEPLKYMINELNVDRREVLKSLHRINLNNDGQSDLIYDGPSGGEPNQIILFRKKDGLYKEVFSGYQHIVAMEFKDSRLYTLTLNDFGCCGDYVAHQNKYLFDKSLAPSVLYERAMVHYTKRPARIWDKPIAFRVSNSLYTLRSSPEIDDTSTRIYDAVGEGNVVAQYTQGCEGFAWAEETDKSGRVWWFVEMKEYRLKRNLMGPADSLSVRQLGWMSNRYLEKLP